MQSGGSGNKGDVWLQSSWAFNVNGMYQVAPDRPWGFNVAANLYGREGYPFPYYFTRSGTQDNIERNISAVTDANSFRAPDIFTTDIRLEKDMPFSDNLTGTFSIDVFNVFNENYVLQRETELEKPTANFVTQTLSPRIYRLGFRVSWR